jgi:3-dehydroquinate synthase
MYPWYNVCMRFHAVDTAAHHYQVIIERGILARLAEFVPPSRGKLFVVTTEDVWSLYRRQVEEGLAARHPHVLFYPGGEERKRLASVEALAEQMVEASGDRSSLVVAVGGGIVTDLGGFLAASFMRGIPVVQVPTTLLAQVDAGIGGKTGVNLRCGKNLFGAFHQPEAVLIDPAALATLPVREYRAGLFEVLKCGIIASPPLFRLLAEKRDQVLALDADVVDGLIDECVRIKAEVVSADEKEGALRRILNFGHTVGHALEAETGYVRFLHGEAVAFGMHAAVNLARLTGLLPGSEAVEMLRVMALYGPIPALTGIAAGPLAARLASDKKTLQGKVHFVLPERVGAVKVVSGIEERLVLDAIEAALR